MRRIQERRDNLGESTNNIERIKKLIYLLNEASNAYYNSEPIINSMSEPCTFCNRSAGCGSWI